MMMQILITKVVKLLIMAVVKMPIIMVMIDEEDDDNDYNHNGHGYGHGKADGDDDDDYVASVVSVAKNKEIYWIQYSLARGYRTPSGNMLWARHMRRGLAAYEALFISDPPSLPSVLVATQHLLSKTMPTLGVERCTCGTAIHRTNIT
jgi:hypothetical protein